jgi:hypothetical protein
MRNAAFGAKFSDKSCFVRGLGAKAMVNRCRHDGFRERFMRQQQKGKAIRPS